MLKYLTVVTIKHNSESCSSQLGNTDKASNASESRDL